MTDPHVSDFTSAEEQFPRTELRRIAGPVIAAALIHLTLLLVYALAFRGDLTAFVCAGRERIGAFPYELVTRGFPTGGYDGQFYYAIARSPWQRHEHGIDLPPARHLRILFPALSWLLTGGDPYWLLWALPLTNLAAISALAGLGAWLALRNGMSVWWGLALPLVCNVGLPALRDLTDAVATLTAFGVLAMWLTRASVSWLTVWAIAAVLSREQNVAIVGVLLGLAAWQRRWVAAAGLSAALALWMAWVGTLYVVYGAWPFIPASGNFAAPFAGLLFRFTHLQGLAHSRVTPVFQVAAVSLVVVEMLLALYLIWRCRDGALQAALLLAVVLAVLAGPSIYGDTWSYCRVLVWLPMSIWLASIQVGLRWPLWTLYPASFSTVLAVARAFAQ